MAGSTIDGRLGAFPPPAGELRFVGGALIVEVAGATPAPAITALVQRHRLDLVDQLASSLTGTRLLLLRIPDGRTVDFEVRVLGADAEVMSAQPNYQFALQARARAAPSDDSLQYALAKLRLPQAHALAKGDNVLIGMIDSAVDTANPELRGAIAASYDAIGSAQKPRDHGTAIAGLIAAHGSLMGSAPAARILAARAFDSDGAIAQGASFNILKGLDWVAARGARVINMSFAGPADPAIHRALEAAFRRGIVMVAAAGNAGPNAPPLYPAADPRVIAVSATDRADNLYAAANRGGYIQLAAPGVDVLVATPGGGYQLSSGTSFSAAEVSGVVALMIERKRGLTPDAVRAALFATARPLGPNSAHSASVPRLVDAYAALAGGHSR